MPSTPFGEQLKRERELRGVSLEEVATATRIAPRFLEALENEQWDKLPGGVFNRGFIRAVARYLGLDEDNLVSEYARFAKEGKNYPLGNFPPTPTSALSASAPKVLIFSPHPDDECLAGGLPLRLKNEQNWHIVNIAVTLGSKLDRREARSD